MVDSDFFWATVLKAKAETGMRRQLKFIFPSNHMWTFSHLIPAKALWSSYLLSILKMEKLRLRSLNVIFKDIHMINGRNNFKSWWVWQCSFTWIYCPQGQFTHTLVNVCVLTLEGYLSVLLSAHGVGQNYYLLCKN